MKNALEAFEKAQTAKLAEKLDKKMTTSSENRERQFEELRQQLRHKSKKIIATVKSKKVKVCRPPPIAGKKH